MLSQAVCPHRLKQQAGACGLMMQRAPKLLMKSMEPLNIIGLVGNQGVNYNCGRTVSDWSATECAPMLLIAGMQRAPGSVDLEVTHIKIAGPVEGSRHSCSHQGMHTLLASFLMCKSDPSRPKQPYYHEGDCILVLNCDNMLCILACRTAPNLAKCIVQLMGKPS